MNIIELKKITFLSLKKQKRKIKLVLLYEINNGSNGLYFK